MARIGGFLYFFLYLVSSVIGEHDDGGSIEISYLSDFFENIHSRNIGEKDVENDNVRFRISASFLIRLEALERFRAIAEAFNLKAIAAERHAVEVCNAGFVFNEENFMSFDVCHAR